MGTGALIVGFFGFVLLLGGAGSAVMKERYDALVILLVVTVLSVLLIAIGAPSALIALSVVAYLISLGAAFAVDAKRRSPWELNAGDLWLSVIGSLLINLLMVGLIVALAVAFAAEGIWGGFAVMAAFAILIFFGMVTDTWSRRPSRS